MNLLPGHKIFDNNTPSYRRQLLYAWMFFPFTLVALFIDSPYFAWYHFDGRLSTNILVLLFFAMQFRASGSRLRKIMFVMVFLSFIGELILCTLLRMYSYRTPDIPVYVPFGHAIVYASGYVFSGTTWACKNKDRLRKVFVTAFILLFAGTGYLLNDPLTVALGILFFALLKRKRWQNLYFCIAVCVIFIELAGTGFGCWTWAHKAFGRIPTGNPPMGAVFFYAAGDVMLAKIATYWEKRHPQIK